MAHYTYCKNCGNNEHKDWIYQCDKCGRIYCDGCKDTGFHLNIECPYCGDYHNTTLGQIDNKPVQNNFQEEDDSYNPSYDDNITTSAGFALTGVNRKKHKSNAVARCSSPATNNTT